MSCGDDRWTVDQDDSPVNPPITAPIIAVLLGLSVARADDALQRGVFGTVVESAEGPAVSRQDFIRWLLHSAQQGEALQGGAR